MKNTWCMIRTIMFLILILSLVEGHTSGHTKIERQIHDVMSIIQSHEESIRRTSGEIQKRDILWNWLEGNRNSIEILLATETPNASHQLKIIVENTCRDQQDSLMRNDLLTNLNENLQQQYNATLDDFKRHSRELADIVNNTDKESFRTEEYIGTVEAEINKGRESREEIENLLKSLQNFFDETNHELELQEYLEKDFFNMENMIKYMINELENLRMKHKHLLQIQDLIYTKPTTTDQSNLNYEETTENVFGPIDYI